MKWIKFTERLPTEHQILSEELIIRGIESKRLLVHNGYFERIENNKLIISTHWHSDREEYKIEDYEWLDEFEEYDYPDQTFFFMNE